MSLSRHGEIYHFDEGAILANHALAHRIDEFPAGYSSAGCSPAGPASASPASAIVLRLILNAKGFAVNGKLSPITVSQPWGSLQTVPNYRVSATGFTPATFSSFFRRTPWPCRKAFRPSPGFVGNQGKQVLRRKKTRNVPLPPNEEPTAQPRRRGGPRVCPPRGRFGPRLGTHGALSLS